MVSGAEVDHVSRKDAKTAKRPAAFLCGFCGDFAPLRETYIKLVPVTLCCEIIDNGKKPLYLPAR